MKISIEELTDDMFMFAAHVDEICAGKLYLSVSGRTAKLNDVVVTVHEIKALQAITIHQADGVLSRAGVWYQTAAKRY